MYPFVCRWLSDFLRTRHPKEDIKVFNSSRKSLVRLIQENHLIKNLSPEWNSYDIYVDIVGFIIQDSFTLLAFVECKNAPITLGNVSQLLGYSRVAHPHYSFIVSPQGASSSLISLLKTYDRTDILQYDSKPGKRSKSLVVAKWDDSANCIDSSSFISDGNAI